VIRFFPIREMARRPAPSNIIVSGSGTTLADAWVKILSIFEAAPPGDGLNASITVICVRFAMVLDPPPAAVALIGEKSGLAFSRTGFPAIAVSEAATLVKLPGPRTSTVYTRPNGVFRLPSTWNVYTDPDCRKRAEDPAIGLPLKLENSSPPIWHPALPSAEKAIGPESVEVPPPRVEHSGAARIISGAAKAHASTKYFI
jgi:hypothetical protein